MSTRTDFYLGRGHDAEWLGSLRAPADSPSVPLPIMRDPDTGLPTAAGRCLTTPPDTQHDTQGEGQ